MTVAGVWDPGHTYTEAGYKHAAALAATAPEESEPPAASDTPQTTA